jgi:endogenous inhibitor of DNA gyrase (YacG/DUF329 family)
MNKTVVCPNCGKSVPWTRDSLWRPFCSERCRLIDLGEWLDERRRIGEPSDGFEPWDQEGDEGHH